ncbi:Granaticin polyketide synthase putative ketoacyl reductase 2 [Fragariocoptes setiger]|uniref:Granaticin polyketide synthase putative ketoacyl reductase 2 n=1 Tax=Fragariocoptes setiger TaxID=1670756 RepID=A0ABQ7SA04_9ACAR|nr:Granaticin polyketide synthase putative ketoacyl reductase 2 [Fragariocoptes setiger]
MSVVIVTGSTSGIGESTANLFADRGYHVVVTGSDSANVDRVVDSIRQKSPVVPEPLGVVADFKDPVNVDSILERTLERFERLDVLVNNAGRTHRKIGPTSGNDPTCYSVYRQAMTINLDSTIRLTLNAVPHLRATKGSIVNVSSIASTRPSDIGFAYCCSKSALSMFGECLATDLCPDIRVNNVLPGPTVTDAKSATLMRDAGQRLCLTQRAGRPEEIANAIYFLASNKPQYITGTNLVIDGGYLIKPKRPSITT